MLGKSIMVQGTTSNAGKTFVTAGLCRVFAQDGYKTAPFKSQNMSTYGFLTAEGKEMSRAQAVQAEAAMTEPSELMNPILLKPVNVKESRLILHGEDQGILPAAEYFKKKEEMRVEVEKAHLQLSKKYDRIVIEGAGSPAEINLSEGDFVNMGMAKMADAPVLLVADIDRGGMLASVYGTVKILPAEQQKRIKGIIINKFRGDKSLLESGIQMISDLTGIPVVGVLPMAKIQIEDEDSLSGQDGYKVKRAGYESNGEVYAKQTSCCAEQDDSVKMKDICANDHQKEFRESQYDLLADLIRENLDMEYIYSLFDTEDYADMPATCKSCTVAGCGGGAEEAMGSNYIYYGPGKGKLNMSLGAALRAADSGHKVLMYQFVKTSSGIVYGRADSVKEGEALRMLTGITKVPTISMKHFLFMMSEEEKEKVRKLNDQKLDELMGMAKSYDMLVLDEALYAVEMGVLSEDKLVQWMRRKPCHLELVLTGRTPTEKILAMAEFVTEIKREKDNSMTGTASRLGIE